MRKVLGLAAFGAALGVSAANAATITIATVNNAQMEVMQNLSTIWEKQSCKDINLVVLE